MTAERSPLERFVRLGPFVVDVSSGEVKKNGLKLRIPEQPTRLLLALLEKPGEIVSREELRTKLWLDDTNVEFNHSIHAAINKLRQALGDSPEQPQFIETIPRRGYRLMLPIGVAMTPGVSAEAHSETPLGSFQSDSKSTGLPLWRRGSGLLISATLLLGLTALIAGVLHFRPKPKSPPIGVAPPAVPAFVPRRVAIVGFKDLSRRNDDGWLSTAFAEMLSTELVTSANLQIVSGEDVAQMKRELAVVDTDFFSQPTLKRIQQNLGAEMIVAGSFMRIGTGSSQDRVRFDIHLQNANTGQTVASLSETGKIQQLFDLIADAGLHLRQQLGAAPLSSSEEAEIRRSMPANSASQSLYFSGMEKLRNVDYVGARQVLMRAVAADPKDALVLQALSAADSAGGYELQALQEAKAAFDRAQGLTYEQGLRVEARYYEAKHEWARAAETYRRLSSLSTQNFYYLIRLAYVQAIEGKPNDSTATLHQLRGLSRSVRDDASIDLAEAKVEQGLGDFKKELVVAEAAVSKGVQADAPLIVARARVLQAVALRHLGDYPKALNSQHEAESIFRTLRDAGGLADVLNDEGNVLNAEGDVGKAETAYRKSEEIARSIGNKRGEAIASTNLGNVFLRRGEPGEALVRHQRAYKLDREVDYKTGEAMSLLSIGYDFFGEGRLSRAKTYYERSLQLSEDIAKKDIKAYALAALGRVLLDAGDLAGAKRKLEEAVSVAQSSGDEFTRTGVLLDLGSVAAAQGRLGDAQSIQQKALAIADSLSNKDLRAAARMALGHTLFLRGEIANARANYEQALVLEHSLNERPQENETRYALAALAIEEQRLGDAKEMLRFLQADVRRSTNVDIELECLILQSELEMLDKHNDATLQIASRVKAASRNDERLELQTAAAQVLAKTAAASHKWTEADRIIQAAVLHASQSGCVACEFEAKFSQCDLSAQKNASRGVLCFEELKTTAAARGFGLIARNAATETAILAKRRDH